MPLKPALWQRELLLNGSLSKPINLPRECKSLLPA